MYIYSGFSYFNFIIGIENIQHYVTNNIFIFQFKYNSTFILQLLKIIGYYSICIIYDNVTNSNM